MEIQRRTRQTFYSHDSFFVGSGIVEGSSHIVWLGDNSNTIESGGHQKNSMNIKGRYWVAHTGKASYRSNNERLKGFMAHVFELHLLILANGKIFGRSN